MSILDTTKFVERLRQTLKDVKSLGVGMKSPNEKFEFWGDDKKKNETEKEKAEDKTYE